MEEYPMLVSAAEMLKKAKAGHYAVGQFNINTLSGPRQS
jgi:fructose-bisphosphate aldolase class II